MAVLGFHMMVTDGVRTQKHQQALYAQGRTTPGPIVTHADGVKKHSNHQVKTDSFGHAVDCCFVVDGRPSWDGRLPWKAYGACVEAVGLTWGGSWTSLIDLPHAELPV
jgi:peptidoglycan L-alanyl-D-glutamate endopeptidase CwlK